MISLLPFDSWPNFAPVVESKLRFGILAPLPSQVPKPSCTVSRACGPSWSSDAARNNLLFAECQRTLAPSAPFFSVGLPLTICITGAGRARRWDRPTAPLSPSTADKVPRAMTLNDSLRRGLSVDSALGASRLGLTVCALAPLIKLVATCCTLARADRVGSRESLTTVVNGPDSRFMRANGGNRQELAGKVRVRRGAPYISCRARLTTDRSSSSCSTRSEPLARCKMACTSVSFEAMPWLLSQCCTFEAPDMGPMTMAALCPMLAAESRLYTWSPSHSLLASALTIAEAWTPVAVRNAFLPTSGWLSAISTPRTREK